MQSRHQPVNDNDLMDLVDREDRVIGSVYQADAPKLVESKAGYVRGTIAFVRNDRGQLWIPRRVGGKSVAPNGLDFSVAEHLQAGESYEDGTVRGFKEELFLDIDQSQLEYLGKLDPIPALPYFFLGVFMYPLNEVTTYNSADYSGAEWLLPEEVIARIDAGESAKSALKPVLAELVLKHS